MIKAIQNRISFQAAYLINGTKPEKKGFVKFIKDEIGDSSKPNMPVDTYEFKKSALVLTGDDCDLIKNPLEVEHFISKFKYVDADEFYDKKTKKLLPNILDFDPVFECYEKIFRVRKNGINTYYSKTHINNAIDKPLYLPRVDFNKQVNLIKAFDILDKLHGKAKTESELACHEFGVYKKILSKNKKLSEINVSGVAGAGQDSVVFNIDEEKVLKISNRPCYPIKFESFDVPVIDKGWVLNEGKIIYYCILPRGKNSNEFRLTRNDVYQVMDEIKEKGYLKQDILPSHFGQIVKIGDKPYLCDYECAKHSNWKSRLFKASPRNC